LSSTPPSTSPLTDSSNFKSGGGSYFEDPYALIKFHHWLFICKLLACIKVNKESELSKEESISKCFQNVFRSKSELKFKLSKILEGGTCYKVFQTEVIGWKSYGVDYQNQHVKYCIRTLTNIVNETSIDIRPSFAENIVERRYSEFEAFLNIFRTNYPGYLFPPLPSRNSHYITPMDVIANRRRHEFHLFLNDLIHHPYLKYSFALSVFLEASSAGLQSFFDFYSHMNMQDGRLEYAKSRDESLGVSKLISNSAHVISNGVDVLATHALKIPYLQSMWNSLVSNVSSLKKIAYQSDPFEDEFKLLQKVEDVGNALEKFYQEDTHHREELAKFSEFLKGLSEIFWSPELSQLMLFTYTAIDRLVIERRNLDEKISTNVVIPISYLGGYSNSLRVCLQQRSQIIEQSQHAKKQAEELEHQHQLMMNLHGNSPENTKGNQVNDLKSKVSEMQRIARRKIQEEEKIDPTIREDLHRVKVKQRFEILVS
jgi:hypothetical protein